MSLRFHAPYMEWAKQRPSPRYDLAISNILGCSLEDLPGAREAVAFSGRNDNGYAPLVDAIAARYDVAPEQVTTAQGTSGANFLVCAALLEPGDEVLVERPGYDPLLGTPRLLGAQTIRFDRVFEDGFRLDPERVRRAITPRTRIVIVNSPNNPTGRIYPPATLERLAAILDEASERNGRRIFLISDEAYNRIVYDGARFRSPVEFYPWSFLAYSYGKTLLAPGERIGYLAIPPTMPGREAFRDAIETAQIAGGWLFPNASMQYALPRLETLSFDTELFQRKRDVLVEALREIGYRVNVPEGTFYLFPESPIADDEEFTRALDREGVLVLPGQMFETPGFFRISLTATIATIEAAIPRFAAAYRSVDATAHR